MAVGDLVLVRPGERIAVDGTIVSGAAAVNQAAITGDSLPIEKQSGDTVFAGTLVEAGAVEVRTAKAEGETALDQIRKLIEEAREQKPPIERLLDKYAKLYTPIALVASIGNAAMKGSLVKRGATIEAMSKVDTVVFDKTGTLTLGMPKLVEAMPLDGMPEAGLVRLAASAEKFSEHPAGRAIAGRRPKKASCQRIPPHLRRSRGWASGRRPKGGTFCWGARRPWPTTVSRSRRFRPLGQRRATWPSVRRTATTPSA